MSVWISLFLIHLQIKMDLSTGALKYVIDCLFTMYVVTTLTILSWRSALCLIEIYFFPTDKFISDLVSFLSGLAACITLFAVEPKLNYIKTYQERNCHSWWLTLLYEDLVYAVVFVSEWFLWRGGWNLNTSYVIADPLIGGWVNFVIGTVLLFALQLFSFVGGCGCSLDGQKSPNDVMFSTEYIRHWKSQHFQVLNN